MFDIIQNPSQKGPPAPLMWNMRSIKLNSIPLYKNAAENYILFKTL